jgi:hypothetical protein
MYSKVLGVVGTGGKLQPVTGVIDTGGKFSAGIIDTGSKFATGINNTSETGGKICRWSRCAAVSTKHSRTTGVVFEKI